METLESLPLLASAFRKEKVNGGETRSLISTLQKKYKDALRAKGKMPS